MLPLALASAAALSTGCSMQQLDSGEQTQSESSAMVSTTIVTAATTAVAPGASFTFVNAAYATTSASPNSDAAYLALGDSLAFGFDPTLMPSGGSLVNPVPSSFVGYPEEAEAFARHLNEANVSCAGETSTSFTKSLAEVQASPVPLDRGCAKMKAAGVMHVAYAESQLDRAVTSLTTVKKTNLVTLSIGADDVAALGDSCAAQAAAAVQAGTLPRKGATAAAQACVMNGLPSTFATLKTNISTILSALRGTGYKNDIVVVTYPSLNYNQPAASDIMKLTNDAILAAAAPFGVKVVSGYDTFKLASGAAGDPCAAGLLIRLPTAAGAPISCDVNPSSSGRALLGAAVYAVSGGKL